MTNALPVGGVVRLSFQHGMVCSFDLGQTSVILDITLIWLIKQGPVLELNFRERHHWAYSFKTLKFVD